MTSEGYISAMSLLTQNTLVGRRRAPYKESIRWLKYSILPNPIC